MNCDNCGNDFEKGICSDCEIELRTAAERTPLELAAGEMYEAITKFLPDMCKDLITEIQQSYDVKILNNPLPQANPVVQDEHKSAE